VLYETIGTNDLEANEHIGVFNPNSLRRHPTSSSRTSLVSGGDDSISWLALLDAIARFWPDSKTTQPLTRVGEVTL
jgi:hypothetical protein